MGSGGEDPPFLHVGAVPAPTRRNMPKIFPSRFSSGCRHPLCIPLAVGLHLTPQWGSRQHRSLLKKTNLWAAKHPFSSGQIRPREPQSLWGVVEDGTGATPPTAKQQRPALAQRNPQDAGQSISGELRKALSAARPGKLCGASWPGLGIPAEFSCRAYAACGEQRRTGYTRLQTGSSTECLQSLKWRHTGRRRPCGVS